MSEDECPECAVNEHTITLLEDKIEDCSVEIEELKEKIIELEEKEDKYRSALDEIGYTVRDALK